MTPHCSLCTRPVDLNCTDHGYTNCCNEPACYGGEHISSCQIVIDDTEDDGPENCTQFTTVNGRLTFCDKAATTVTRGRPRCKAHA